MGGVHWAGKWSELATSLRDAISQSKRALLPPERHPQSRSPIRPSPKRGKQILFCLVLLVVAKKEAPLSLEEACYLAKELGVVTKHERELSLIRSPSFSTTSQPFLVENFLRFRKRMEAEG